MLHCHAKTKILLTSQPGMKIVIAVLFFAAVGGFTVTVVFNKVQRLTICVLNYLLHVCCAVCSIFRVDCKISSASPERCGNSLLVPKDVSHGLLTGFVAALIPRTISCAATVLVEQYRDAASINTILPGDRCIGLANRVLTYFVTNAPHFGFCSRAPRTRYAAWVESAARGAVKLVAGMTSPGAVFCICSGPGPKDHGGARVAVICEIRTTPFFFDKFIVMAPFLLCISVNGPHHTGVTASGHITAYVKCF